jgi:hypothetical protein
MSQSKNESTKRRRALVMARATRPLSKPAITTDPGVLNGIHEAGAAIDNDQSAPPQNPRDLASSLSASNNSAITPVTPNEPVVPFQADLPEVSVTSTGDATRNGDNTDVRMEEIAKILTYAAMRKLEKYELVAEWVRYAEAQVSVFGQPVSKPQGGRPEGGVSRAARELPVPGKTFGARRKFIVRAVDIDAIPPEAKVAARAAGLDDNQSALLAIAKEKTPEAQLAKVKELAARRAQPRRKNTQATKRSADSADGEETVNGSSAHAILSTEDEACLSVMRDAWMAEGCLKRSDWEAASSAVQQLFVRDLLFVSSTS